MFGYNRTEISFRVGGVSVKDPRIEKLARNLINYSVQLQKGEKVLIENFGLQRELVTALVKEAYAAGGYPFVLLKDHQWTVPY